MLWGLELWPEFDVLEAFFNVRLFAGVAVVVADFASLVATIFLAVGVGSLEPPADAGLDAADATCCADCAGNGVADVALDEFGAVAEAWGVRL